jgi:hypothetical protein
LASANPVLDPLLLTPLRNAVVNSAWGRGKKDIPPGIARKLQDTTVITSVEPVAPAFARNRDVARSMRVEKVSDRAKGQQFKVRDERQGRGAPQAANAPRAETLKADTPKADKADRGGRSSDTLRVKEQPQKEKPQKEQRGVSPQAERAARPVAPRAERVAKPAKAERVERPVQPQGERVSRPVERPKAKAQAAPAQPRVQNVQRAEPQQKQKQQQSPAKPAPAQGGGKGKGKKP